MAGTDDEPSTFTWIDLRTAFARVQARYPGQVLPSRMIKAALEAGHLPIRAWYYKGRMRAIPISRPRRSGGFLTTSFASTGTAALCAASSAAGTAKAISCTRLSWRRRASKR
jgi:hypothetical protein